MGGIEARVSPFEGLTFEGFALFRVLIFEQVRIIEKDISLPKPIQETFLDSYYYTGEVVNPVSVFRRFGGGPNQAKLFGYYSTTEAVLSRSDLAILKKWSNMRFEAELLVDKGGKLNMGKIAPQEALKGGADQVLLPWEYPESWIKLIKDLQTGQIYTLEEFKVAFPDQLR